MLGGLKLYMGAGHSTKLGGLRLHMGAGHSTKLGGSLICSAS